MSLPRHTDEAVLAAYRQHGSLNQAGKALGYSREYVRQRLDRMGIETRNPARRKTSRNRTEISPRDCPVCGKVIPTAGRSPGAYRRIKTCGDECGRKHRRSQLIGSSDQELYAAVYEHRIPQKIGQALGRTRHAVMHRLGRIYLDWLLEEGN
jgi:hypothetical protein